MLSGWEESEPRLLARADGLLTKWLKLSLFGMMMITMMMTMMMTVMMTVMIMMLTKWLKVSLLVMSYTSKAPAAPLCRRPGKSTIEYLVFGINYGS